MKYLLDTHAFIWALTGDGRLPQHIKEIIDDLKNDIYVSTVSLWEIALKKEKWGDRFPFETRKLATFAQGAGYRFLGLSVENVFCCESLKDKDDANKHKDPFDRLLLAQAKSTQMTLLTHDSQFQTFEEDCILLF